MKAAIGCLIGLMGLWSHAGAEPRVEGRVPLPSGATVPGTHTARRDATDAAAQAVGAGVYLYRLSGGEAKITRSMLLIDRQAGIPSGGSGSNVLEGCAGFTGPISKAAFDLLIMFGFPFTCGSGCELPPHEQQAVPAHSDLASSATASGRLSAFRQAKHRRQRATQRRRRAASDRKLPSRQWPCIGV